MSLSNENSGKGTTPNNLIENNNELITLIRESLESAGNNPNSEKALKSSLRYLSNNKQNKHLFCDQNIYPIASYCLILFSFSPSNALINLKQSLSHSLDCIDCLRCFNNAKAELRNKFLIVKRISVSNVNNFINSINNFEVEILQTKISTIETQLDSNFDVDQGQLEIVLNWCLNSVELLRKHKPIRQTLTKIIKYLQVIKRSNPFQILLPGLLFLLFDGTTEEFIYARDWVSNLRKSNVVYNASTIEEAFILEFSVHLYYIQEPKNYTDKRGIRFWNNFYDLIDFIDNDGFLARLNKPKDIAVMSQNFDLRFYPSVILLTNYLMSYLTEPLPALLRVFDKLLVRLGPSIWSYTSITPTHLLDGILSNSEFPKQLQEASIEKSIMSDYTLDELVSWMNSLMNTLSLKQRQNICVRMGSFLLRQQAPVSNSHISSNDMRAQRAAVLQDLGCKTFLNGLGSIDVSNINDPKFAIELMSLRDIRAAIEIEADKIIQIAIKSNSDSTANKLTMKLLNYDLSILVTNSNLLSKSQKPTTFDTFPMFWESLANSKIYSNIDFSVEIVKSFNLIIYATKFQSVKSSSEEKHIQESKKQHNENMDKMTNLMGQIFAKFGFGDPLAIQEILKDSECLDSLWSCIFSPLMSQSAIEFMNELYDGSGRFETVQESLNKNLRLNLKSININLKILTDLAHFEPTPKAVRILMDIIKALTDPMSSILTSPQVEFAYEQIVKLWSRCWSFLIMIYEKTLVWAGQYHIEELIEFTRDTLDTSHLLLDSFRIIIDSIEKWSDEKVSQKLFKVFMNGFEYMIVWLKLGDVSLLNSCVDLVFKGFDLAVEQHFTIDDSFIDKFARYGAKAKKYNNKLSELQRQAILSKAKQFNSDLVDKIIDEVNASKKQDQKKSSPQPIEIKSDGEDDVEFVSSNVNDDVKFLSSKIRASPSMRQSTLKNFMNSTDKKPVAPFPKAKPLSSLEQMRRSLVQKRNEAKPAKSIYTPAPARPAGFNSSNKEIKPSQPPPVSIGRSLNKERHRKAKNNSSDEESDEGEDNDFSDLFVTKGAKKNRLTEKITQVDENMQEINAAYLQRKKAMDLEKLEKERQRLRLNVNLKPLYSTILRWNYNSTSQYPGPDKSIYQNVKDTYSDVKEYVKVTEPLFLLECWQAIQSAKMTIDEQPFELLIGSRTSVDGFFDVFASMKKQIVQDRKLTESDLIVLSCKNEAFNEPREIRKFMKQESAKTCLAKIREIKYVNQDYCDITFRVYPVGPMMAALTPKSEILGMKVMQMVTVEREFTSLRGLQWYDLNEAILKASPNKPIEVDDAEADCMKRIFNVNKSQAKAIMGSYQSDGFSLIQGPPGTGKTKTILGIVGYSLSKQRSDKIIELPNGQKPQTQNENTPKILICAPSNAAVDELVLRLRDGVKDSKGEHMSLKVVRLGRSDAINVAVRDLTLEELVDKELQTTQTMASVDPQIRQTFNELTKKRDELRKKLNSNTLGDKETQEVEKEFRETNYKRKEMTSKLDAQREAASIQYRQREIDKRNIQAKILNQAQILCATLSGSAHDLVANLQINFDQVIIDEACQCSELAAIIPLRYGCKKCIMVGDPKQLPPTVLSQAAASFSYDQSLFVRMQQNNPNSIYLLDVQYRMHPMISKFPSKEFYDSKLLDGENMLDVNSRPWHNQENLSAYRFFDITSRHEKNELTRSLYNSEEADVTLQLVEKLIMLMPDKDIKGKIGVISPYKEQIQTIKNKFVRKYGKYIFDQIDFNTVDGFQGQEKDIIIMSCVRASATGNVGFLSDIRRMNVALTRAKTTLWILGNKESLSRNQVWKRLLDDATERNCVTKAFPGFLNEQTTKRPSNGNENRPSKKQKMAPIVPTTAGVLPNKPPQNHQQNNQQQFLNPQFQNNQFNNSQFQNPQFVNAQSQNAQLQNITNFQPQIIQPQTIQAQPTQSNIQLPINNLKSNASPSQSPRVVSNGVFIKRKQPKKQAAPPATSNRPTVAEIRKKANGTTSSSTSDVKPTPTSTNSAPTRSGVMAPRPTSSVAPSPTSTSASTTNSMASKQKSSIGPTSSGIVRPPPAKTSSLFIPRKRPPKKD